MIQGPVGVRLKLESRAENVVLTRAAVSGLAAAAEFGPELTADLKTAVSEACNNVVLHAYGGAIGPLLVEMSASRDGVAVTVTDRGSGLTRISGGEDRMGLGLAVISALANRSEFGAPDGGGTAVRMWFSRQTGVVDGAGAFQASGLGQPAAGLDGEIVAQITPVRLFGYVLAPILRTLAASVGFSISRVDELRDLSAALAVYAEAAADHDVGVALSSSTRRVSLSIGPFRIPDASSDDVSAAGTDGLVARRKVIDGLVDELSIEQDGTGELIRLLVADAGSLGATGRPGRGP